MKGRRIIRPSSLVATLAVTALLASACGVPSGPRATWWNGNVDPTAEYTLAMNIKHTRLFLGGHELTLHGVLIDKGRWWSQQMASGACSPSKICHSQLTHMIHGRVQSWSLIGENVGVGGNLGSLWHAFIHSAPHQRNILDSRWHYYGVGVVRTGNTYWVTMVFMRM